MNIPTDLRYTSEHEWVSAITDGVARVGVTEYAAEALGDVVYVELPEVGQQVSAGSACGEIESTKSVSELFAPVTGQIVAVNTALADNPELVNAQPYGDGWLIEVRVAEEPAGLLEPTAYQELTNS